MVSRHGESLARTEGKVDATLAAVLSRQQPTGTTKAKDAIFSVLGHWGTISTLVVAAAKWLWPHVRLWLGLG
jgi:hypothetical protein